MGRDLPILPRFCPYCKRRLPNPKIKRPDPRTIQRGIELLNYLKRVGPQHQAKISKDLDWEYRTTGYALKALTEDGCVFPEIRFGRDFVGKNAKSKGRKYYHLTPGGDFQRTTSLRDGKYQTNITIAQAINTGLLKINRDISDTELIAKARRDGFWEKPEVQEDFKRLIGNVREGLRKPKTIV